jgi:hypothetical protein
MFANAKTGDAHAGVAEQQEDVSSQVVAAKALLL